MGREARKEQLAPKAAGEESGGFGSLSLQSRLVGWRWGGLWELRL